MSSLVVTTEKNKGIITLYLMNLNWIDQFENKHFQKEYKASFKKINLGELWSLAWSYKEESNFQYCSLSLDSNEDSLLFTSI